MDPRGLIVLLADRLLLWVPLLLSLTVHEWAHAQCAWWLGDETAERAGQRTLNPLAHLDPLGTLVLPLLGVPFGWARPVPINPFRLRRVPMGMGLALTASSGPLANLLIAVGLGLGLGLSARLGLLSPAAHWLQLAQLTVLLNVLLALFNLLPVPPLDGSRIVGGVLPDRWRPAWEAFERLGVVPLALVLLALTFLGGRWLVWLLALLSGALTALLSG